MALHMPATQRKLNTRCKKKGVHKWPYVINLAHIDIGRIDLVAQVGDISLRCGKVSGGGIEVLRQKRNGLLERVFYHTVSAQPQTHRLCRRDLCAHVQALAELEVSLDGLAATLRGAGALLL